MSAGIDAGQGADAVITRLATDAGIPVRFELGDVQASVAWFTGMDRQLEVDHLMWTIERVAAAGHEIDQLVQAWMQGDLSFADEQDRKMRHAHPALRARYSSAVERSAAVAFP